MLSLQGRQDTFRLLLPKDFFVDEIIEKYSKLLKSKNGFITNPVDFVNESIQSIDILGFENAAFLNQLQPSTGHPTRNENRIDENKFMYPHSEFAYRAASSPLALIDKTINIMFRHTLGYINYFMLFENFWYLYSRDTSYSEMCQKINIDILDERGVAYSRISIFYPIINGMDMLSMNFTAVLDAPQAFKMELKYSNLTYEFIDYDEETQLSIINPEYNLNDDKHIPLTN